MSDLMTRTLDEARRLAGIGLELGDLQVEQRREPPTSDDFFVGLALLSLSLLQIIFTDIGPPSDLAVPVAAAASFGYWLRHTIPILATWVTFGPYFGASAAALAQGESTGPVVGQIIAAFAVAYAATRWLRLRAAVPLMSIIIIGYAVIGSAEHEGARRVLVDTTPWVVVAVLAIAMRYRHRLLNDQYESVRSLERRALARDLHDTIAHHATAIAVQAQAARFATDHGRDLDHGVFDVIANSAEQSLYELELLSAVEDHPEWHHAPYESLLDLTKREDGPTVSLVGEADLTQFSAEIANTLYRIAQEAVSNARRHNRDVTAIEIDLRHNADTAVLLVVNDGVPTVRNRGSGFGTTGMSERAEALGGTFESGPRRPDGWRVAATIPLAPSTVDETTYVASIAIGG